MIFSQKDIIGGLPAKVARDCLFWSKWEPVTGPETFARNAKVGQAEAQNFFAYCLEKQWLVPAAEAGCYEFTQLGIQAGAARIGKPLSREKAEKLLEGVLQRAREWNSFPAVGARVKDIHIFGSYLTDAPLLGDLDLIVDFERQPGFDYLSAEEQDVLITRFAERQGWAVPRTHFGTVVYWQGAMFRYLKARQSSLSFGSMSDLKMLNCPSKVIFSALKQESQI